MTVTLERVASLQAEMDAGQSASEVLSRVGLTQADYLTSKETYLRAIADEVRGGRQVLLRRYQAAFIEQQLRLQPKPDVKAAVASSRVSASSAVSAARDQGAAPFVPSYLRKESPSSPMMAASPSVLVMPAPDLSSQSRPAMKMTMMADTGPRGPATPFQPRSVTPQPQSRPLPSTEQPSPAPPPSAAPQSVRPASSVDSQKHTIVADGASAASLLASVPFRNPQRSMTPAPQSVSPVSARVASGTVAADLSAPATNPLTTEEIGRHASAQAGIKAGREPKDAILARWGFNAQSFAETDARWSAQFITDGAARSLWMSVYSARLASG